MIETFLVVPFSARENHFSLLKRAFDWRYNLKNAYPNRHLPQILVYQRSDEPDDEYEYLNSNTQSVDDVKFRFPSSLPDNSVIYILADEVEFTDLVGNTSFSNDEEYILPIDVIAARLKKMGLTPEIADRLSCIKLYICCSEKAEINQKLATNFSLAMGDEYKSVTIEYYTKLLKLPNEEGRKMAYEIGQNPSDLVLLGRASQYRNKFQIKSVLSNDTPSPAFDLNPNLPACRLFSQPNQTSSVVITEITEMDEQPRGPGHGKNS